MQDFKLLLLSDTQLLFLSLCSNTDVCPCFLMNYLFNSFQFLSLKVVFDFELQVSKACGVIDSLALGGHLWLKSLQTVVVQQCV